MQPYFRRLCAVLLALAAASVAPALHALDRQLEIKPTMAAPSGEKRMALIIGNSAYKTAPLRNPVNDARAIAKALAGMGFSVTVLEDGTYAAMWRAIRSFGDHLRAGGIGLFYYAGHGMQVRGRNFLIPVNADLEREEEVEFQAIDANLVLARMDAAKNGLNLLVLDACRNNPFARSFRSASQGLAQMDAPSGTLIAFATAPGSVAADGDGDNGIYTKHLLANLARPGVPVELMFKNVRIGVTRETSERQVPWESSSLKGNFYFVPGEATLSGEAQRREIEKTVNDRLAIERAEQQRRMEAMLAELLAKQRAQLEEEMLRRGEQIAAAATPPERVASDPARIELGFWDSVKASTNPADLEAYLARYPDGTFSVLARNRLDVLKPPPAPQLKPQPVRVASAAPTALIGTGIDDPRFPKIGDSWEYSYVDTTSRAQRALRMEVTGATREGILEIGGFRDQPTARAHAAGAQLFFNNFWDLSPFLLSFTDPKPGDRWSDIPYTNYRGCSPPASCTFSGKVDGRERITTKAGSFDALKIVVDLNSRGLPGGLTTTTNVVWRQLTFWYSEQAKRVVKSIVRTRAGATFEPDYDLELVSYKLN